MKTSAASCQYVSHWEVDMVLFSMLYGPLLCICGKPSVNHCLPARELYPLCLGLGPGSGLSSLHRPFHRPRQTMHSCGNGLCACQHAWCGWRSLLKYVSMWVFFKLHVLCTEFNLFLRIALYKNYPLLLFVNAL